MTKKPAAPAISTLFPPRHRMGYLLVLIAAVVLFGFVTRVYRRRIDQFQYRRIRYAAERAIDALRQGDPPLARREVELLSTERPLSVSEGLIFTRQFSDVYEGPVLRNRVMPYEQLTAELLKAGMLPEAESIAWKTLLEYHVVSRTLEMLIPWNLLYHVKLARGDWYSVFESMKILAVHGVQRIETPDQLQPVAYAFDPKLTRDQQVKIPDDLMHTLKVYYEAEQPDEFRGAGDLLENDWRAAAEPILRRHIRSLEHRALTEAGQRDAARRLLAQVWGRDPALMDPFWREWPAHLPVMNLLDRDPTILEYLWRDRPATSTVTIAAFVDSFNVDARVQIDDLRGLRKVQTGYFARDNNIMFPPDCVLFYQSVGATLDVALDQPVFRIYLAYASSVALGIRPILLLKIDDEPYLPIYCDSPTPALAPIDVKLPPGNHRFEFVYLNDAGFVWPSRAIEENRNLSLYRMVLVHAQPRE